MFFSVNKERSDFKKRFYIFENIFNLNLIPISAYDLKRRDSKPSALSFDVIGNENANTVKQFI